MKKFLFILLIANICLFAQSEQKSVELPDFVILGRQRIDVPTISKNKPELVGIVSEDFLLPKYSPEELPLLISNFPKPVIPVIDDLDNSFFGNVNFGLGRYTYPLGELNLNKMLNYYLLHVKVWGTNIKEYIPFAGYNVSGISIDNNFFVSTNSNLLPGSEIKLNGIYTRDSYHFFGSNSPDSIRNTGKSSFNFSFTNNYNKWVNAGINLKANFLNIRENNFKEKLLFGSGYFESRIQRFLIGGNFIYQKQILTNNLSGIDSYNNYLVEGYSKINALKNIILKLGVSYSSTDNDNFISPFASANIKINNELAFNVEFNPHSEFLTISNFLERNLYITTNDSLDNVFMKVPIDLNASLKYEYKNQMILKIWSAYKSIKNYPYFEDNKQKGFFNVYTQDNIQSYELGTDILLNSSIYGFIDATFRLSSIKNEDNKYIPYKPLYNFNITYGYNFPINIGINIKYNFMKHYYADLNNSKLIPDYHNLSFGINYNISNLSFKADFHNILNRSNFVFDGYQEKLFDIILGVEYRWQ
ncbi:hypothetical protein [Rosettibacter firmus]|uniref:hypothetical protein n=1 Tax=Rosettibacter firmus TaxID=3111522 RepID=UPI00336BB549